VNDCGSGLDHSQPADDMRLFSSEFHPFFRGLGMEFPAGLRPRAGDKFTDLWLKMSILISRRASNGRRKEGLSATGGNRIVRVYDLFGPLLASGLQTCRNGSGKCHGLMDSSSRIHRPKVLSYLFYV